MSLVELKNDSILSDINSQIVKNWFADYLATGEFDQTKFELEEINRDEEDKLIPTRAFYFKATINDVEYFVKTFHQRQNFVESELINNNVFDRCEGVRIPTLHQVLKSDSFSLLVYDYIKGQTLQSYLSDTEATMENSKDDIMLTVLNQSIALSLCAEKGNPKTINLAGPAKTPFSTHILNTDFYKKSMEVYEPFAMLKPTIEDSFPGYILDRHPRNMIVSNSDVFQTDFEIVGLSSPIFELTKMLRGGVTKTYKPAALSSLDNEELIQKSFLELNAFTAEEENAYVDYYFFNRYPEYGSKERDLFHYLYTVAAAHSHLNLMNRALVAKKADPDLNIASSSAMYHLLGYLSLQANIYNGSELLNKVVSRDQIHELNLVTKEIAINFNLAYE